MTEFKDYKILVCIYPAYSNLMRDFFFSILALSWFSAVCAGTRGTLFYSLRDSIHIVYTIYGIRLYLYIWCPIHLILQDVGNNCCDTMCLFEEGVWPATYWFDINIEPIIEIRIKIILLSSNLTVMLWTSKKYFMYNYTYSNSVCFLGKIWQKLESS